MLGRLWGRASGLIVLSVRVVKSPGVRGGDAGTRLSPAMVILDMPGRVGVILDASSIGYQTSLLFCKILSAPPLHPEAALFKSSPAPTQPT